MQAVTKTKEPSAFARPQVSWFRKFIGAGCLFSLLLVLNASVQASQKEHGLSIFGPSALKYKKGEPFEYLNPNAPIVGTLRLTGGYYSKLSYFGAIGVTAPGIDTCYDSLGIKSWDDDEAFSVYGVLAESFEMADDKLSMKVYLRPEARFSDGKPVTADDVIFSYELLEDPDMKPGAKNKWKGVKDMEKIDQHTVNILFKEAGMDQPIWSTYLIVFPKHVYGAPGKNLGKDFEDLPPVGSGAYALESYVRGQSVTYVRRDDYWGNHLPYHKGHHNWKRIEYQIYYDDFSKIEALKSGMLDFLCWLPRDVYHGLKGDYFDKGYIIKEAFPITRPAAMKCYLFNLRKPIFQDRELRKVIISLYDFDYINRNFYYSEDERLTSYFNNQPQLRAAPGPAKGEVLKILQQLARKHNRPKEGLVYVPQGAFIRGPYELGTDSQGKRIPIEERITAASQRLNDLGWIWNKSAACRMKDGVRLQFEIMEPSSETFHYTEVLKRAGISAVRTKLSELEVQSRKKSRRYDLSGGWFDGRKAPGRELAQKFLSNEADIKGSANELGLKNPAIDEVLGVLSVAESQRTVELYAKIFDRIMCANWYVVPRTWPTVDHAVYWAHLRRPKIGAPGLWINYPIIWYWWFDKDRYQQIQNAIKTGTPLPPATATPTRKVK